MPETPATPVEAVDPFQGRSPSLAEYETFRKTGKLPEEPKPAETKEEPPAAKAETAEGQEPSKEAEQEKTELERDEQGRFRKKVEFTPEQQEAFDRAFRKREAKLRREYEERYAQTSEAQATPAETKAETADADEPEEPKLPKLSEYQGTIEEYDKEVADYPKKLAAYLEAKRQAEERVTSIQSRLADSEAKAQKTHPDYQDEVGALYKDIASDEEPKLPAYVVQAIAEGAENPHELTYHLAKNRADFRKLAALEPNQALREVIKLELRLQNAPAPEKKPAAPKPKPPEVVGARAATSAFDVNDEKLSADEWRARREEQLRTRR